MKMVSTMETHSCGIPAPHLRGLSRCMNSGRTLNLRCGSWNSPPANRLPYGCVKRRLCKGGRIDVATGRSCQPLFFRLQGGPGRCRSGDGVGRRRGGQLRPHRHLVNNADVFEVGMVDAINDPSAFDRHHQCHRRADRHPGCLPRYGWGASSPCRRVSPLASAITSWLTMPPARRPSRATARRRP